MAILGWLVVQCSDLSLSSSDFFIMRAEMFLVTSEIYGLGFLSPPENMPKRPIGYANLPIGVNVCAQSLQTLARIK